MYTKLISNHSNTTKMGSSEQFITYVTGFMGLAGEITYKKMFGEYGIYLNQKIIALVCDNQLFIKPTVAGKEFIGDVVESPAYPGSKNFFLIESKFEDQEWIAELLKITYAELPEPKPKKPKKKKS